METGTPDAEAAAYAACDWLITREIVDVRGDWAVRRPDAPLSGWPFQYRNDHYPDLDDTAAVIAALHEAFSAKKDLTTAKIVRMLQNSPPLSVTMAEKVHALRKWAQGRCVPAE